MDVLQAIVLGIVQGLGEFLPISSSAHLILVPYLFGWTGQSLAYDLALHLGTAVALLGYFWRDWAALASAFFRGLVSREVRATDASWRLAWLVILGSFPAGIAGLLLRDFITTHYRSPVLNAGLLILFAVVLLVADRVGKRRREMREARWVDALAVGCWQALALFPGASRSGVTITAGLFMGLERAAAARFSFLLSGPIVVAAALFELRHGLPPGEANTVVVGIIASAITGWLAIGFLLRFLQRNSVLPFVVYRFVLGLGVIGVALTRGF